MTTYENQADLNRMLRTGEDGILIIVRKLLTGTMTSSRGKTYLSVSLEYSELGSEEVKIRTRPVSTDEGNLMVMSGPYDEGAAYLVTRGFNKGYQKWKKIIPCVSEQAA